MRGNNYGVDIPNLMLASGPGQLVAPMVLCCSKHTITYPDMTCQEYPKFHQDES
jgi:hypothetical protein